MATTNDTELGIEWLPIAFLIYMLLRRLFNESCLTEQ